MGNPFDPHPYSQMFGIQFPQNSQQQWTEHELRRMRNQQALGNQCHQAWPQEPMPQPQPQPNPVLLLLGEDA